MVEPQFVQLALQKIGEPGGGGIVPGGGSGVTGVGGGGIVPGGRGGVPGVGGTAGGGVVPELLFTVTLVLLLVQVAPLAS